MAINKLAKGFFIFLILAALGIGYFYFFNISPTFVEKPDIEKPALLNERVDFRHVVFLLNELDVYKLHDKPISGESPVIEILIYDTGQVFQAEVIDNKIMPTENRMPDLKIKVSSDVLIDLIEKGIVDSFLIESFSSGKISIEIIEDEATLILKGYKVIYDKLSPENNVITGDVAALDPTGYKRGISFSFLAIFSFLIGLIVEKEL